MLKITFTDLIIQAQERAGIFVDNGDQVSDIEIDEKTREYNFHIS